MKVPLKGIMCCALVALTASGLRAGDIPNLPSIAEKVKLDTEKIARFESRVVGSEGHDKALSELESRLRGIKNIEIFTEEFDVYVPSVEEAVLTVERGPARGRHRIYPLWPALVRLQTTPPDGVSGKLVYVGGAKPTEIDPKALRGGIAVMEAVGSKDWHNAVMYGAKSIILLGSKEDTYDQMKHHLTEFPLNVPRFYVPEGQLADALRQVSGEDSRVKSNGSWKKVKARNIYALIKPSKNKETVQAIALAVPTDSMSVVPELSPGADSAVDVAMALNCLEYFSQKRPTRPILFIFADAYAINHLGIRRALATLNASSSERDAALRRDEKEEKDFRERLELAKELKADPDGMWKLCRPSNKKMKNYVEDEVLSRIVKINTDLYALRSAEYRTDDPAELKILEDQIHNLSERKTRLNSVKRQMTSSGKSSWLKRLFKTGAEELLADISEESLPLAQDVWNMTLERTFGQIEDLDRRIVEADARDKLHEKMAIALGFSDNPAQLISFLFGLDLSDSGYAAGAMLRGDYMRTTESANAEDFLLWLDDLYRKQGKELWSAKLKKGVMPEVNTMTDSSSCYLVGKVAGVAELAKSFGVASVNWSTLDGYRFKIDTPNDSFDLLNWERLNPQVDATFRLIERMINDVKFKPKSEHIDPVWRRVSGVVVTDTPGEPVPRLPMKGYLVTMFPAGSGVMFNPDTNYSEVPGLRRYEFVESGHDGQFFFDDMPGHNRSIQMYIEAYRLAEDGSIIGTLDLTKQGKQVRLTTYVSDLKAEPLRGVVFDCQEVSVFGFTHPRFLLDLGNISILDARRASPPQRMNSTVRSGTLSCLVEPGMLLQYVARAGIAGNSMSLVNLMDPDESGSMSMRKAMRGFSIDEQLPDHPLMLSATDFYRVNEKRLRSFENAGIQSEAIAETHEETARMLSEAETAAEKGDGKGFFKAVTHAASNELRTYKSTRDTADDVVRAAIFLLLMLVPFAWAMERLLFASAHIYRQIVTSMLIFAGMTILLYLFHPAFKISAQPLIIIISFGVILMSITVISMIFTKFKVSMEELRSDRAEASGASTSYSGLATTALKLGIANMRKRKLRTALTGITVMLITFALMCFMSTTNIVGQKQFKVNSDKVPSAVYIRQPSRAAMPVMSREYVSSVMPEGTRIAERWWWLSSWEREWRVHVRNPETGALVSLTGAIGLNEHEAELTGIDKVCPDWDRFKNGKGCYLSADAVSSLGVEPGDILTVAGRDLEFIGVFDPDGLKKVKTIDGMSILPIDYFEMGDAERTQARDRGFDIQMLSEEMSAGKGIGAETTSSPMDATKIMVVHESVFSTLGMSELHGLAFRMDSYEEAREVAYDFSKRLSFPIYYGAEDGTWAVANTPLLPKAPKSLIIPVIIAGLIILNTMLSSIAERKKEVYVYTSLGLAPFHVGLLFLAEAVTYGLMGSIFGYVVGQGGATLLGKFGLLGSITLNYSGTQAVMTMGLVLVVVIVSSLIPAYLAGRLATPSNEMKWTVPSPKNGIIQDILPFTATPKIANALVKFLYDYFEAHRDGAIGNFSSDKLELFTSRTGDKGQIFMGIRGEVWLAPYDLSVRQDFAITTELTDDKDVLMLAIELKHQAGQVSNWKNLNKTFLGDLRRQLLGWRKLKSDRVLRYIAEAKEVMKSGKMIPGTKQ